MGALEREFIEVLGGDFLAGGIHEEEFGAVQGEFGFEEIAGGAGDVGDDGLVAAQEAIEETRLADVGAADDADAGTFGEDLGGGARAEKVVES